MINYLTVSDVQKMFKVSRRTVNNWMKDKDFPYLKIGRTVRFDEYEVEMWVEKINEATSRNHK